MAETDKSQDAFEKEWAQKVATQFGLDYNEVYSIYTNDDQWNTNMNTRAMWKANTARGANGTPTTYINGVVLPYSPASPEEWVMVLQQVYDSQYHA